MPVSEENRVRYRAIQISRAVKEIFMAVPERFAVHVARRWLFGPILRWLFLAPDGSPHRAGEIVLAEFRDGYLLKSPFASDPLELARRAGQREVLTDLFNYLNLDEGSVQKLMVLDDGLE